MKERCNICRGKIEDSKDVIYKDNNPYCPMCNPYIPVNEIYKLKDNYEMIIWIRKKREDNLNKVQSILNHITSK